MDLKTENFALVRISRFSTIDGQSWRITALTFSIRVSISSLSCLPSLENVTPRYLNFSVFWRVTLFAWKEHWTECLDMHMISVLAILIFIPASKHALANRSSAYWRSLLFKFYNVRSSANSRR